MQIHELPGVEPGDAAWWKLVRAMGVIYGLERRVAQLEDALRDVSNIDPVNAALDPDLARRIAQHALREK